MLFSKTLAHMKKNMKKYEKKLKNDSVGLPMERWQVSDLVKYKSIIRQTYLIKM